MDDLRLRRVRMDDPVLAPVLDDLGQDYARRYPQFDTAREMSAYPVEEFVPPRGAVLVLEDGGSGGSVLAAGAYKRYDEHTAELKRVWTSQEHRRRGLGARIVVALEDHARAAGYRAAYLTTGPSQPEARALYLALGYTPIGDHDAAVVRKDRPLAFRKPLVEQVRGGLDGRHDDLDETG